VLDWSGGLFASCMLRVQLSVNACNGWLQFALLHHWLLPINYHFRDCKAHRFTQMINEVRDKDYLDRLKELNLWTLEDRQN